MSGHIKPGTRVKLWSDDEGAVGTIVEAPKSASLHPDEVCIKWDHLSGVRAIASDLVQEVS